MPVDSFFLAKSFVTLLVIIDPVGVVPVFLAMTGPYDPGQRHRAAWQAVLVAALIIGVFALFGQQILLYLGIRLPSLEAAGGLLLLVVALDLLRGEVQELAGEGKVNVAFVPLGTPLLAGPGGSPRSWCSCARRARPLSGSGSPWGCSGCWWCYGWPCGSPAWSGGCSARPGSSW
jgi:MarC family membrane protein